MTAPPFVIGMDLAWGTRAPTGIAVLDPTGMLIEYASLKADRELDTLLAPFLAGPCVVAIDAPLIVRNATGRRPCETAISRAFASQHAGTYPSNTGLAAFANGGRGAAFARRHDLDVDGTAPPAAGQRRALEVYPHSATVAVFDLPRVLAYKARPSRPLTGRKQALIELTRLLGHLAHPVGLPALTTPPGLLADLEVAIAEAPTAAALRRLEDPLDALVCAYVGLLFLAGLTCAVGDAASGAIVTPIRERHVPLLGDDAIGATPISAWAPGSLSR